MILDAPATGHALADPARCAYVGVSLAEELSVQETIELDERLHAKLGRRLDLVVVDGVHPDRFTGAEARRLRTLLARHPEAGAIRAALLQHRRARRQAHQVAELARRVPAPVVTLPFVFESEIGPGGAGALRGRPAPDHRSRCGETTDAPPRAGR